MSHAMVVIPSLLSADRVSKSDLFIYTCGCADLVKALRLSRDEPLDVGDIGRRERAAAFGEHIVAREIERPIVAKGRRRDHEDAFRGFVEQRPREFSLGLIGRIALSRRDRRLSSHAP